MSSESKVFLLLRTHNRPEEFNRCIESISKQSLLPEIIIISDDKNDTYNIDVWQRIRSVEELLWKIEWLRDDDFFKAKLREYRKNYRKVLLSKKQYSEEFNKKMDALI